jgi:hypothetical protein
MTKRSKNQLAPAPSVDLVALAEYVERFSTKTVVVLRRFRSRCFPGRRHHPRLPRSPRPHPQAP